jgi:hypothetical protein
MPTQRRQKERPVDSVGGSGARSDGTLEHFDRAIMLAQPRVHVREVVRRDELLALQLLELVQHLARALMLSGESVDLAQLPQPQGMPGRLRARPLQLGDTALLLPAQEAGPPQRRVGTDDVGVDVHE